jgi:hypothetical protein
MVQKISGLAIFSEKISFYAKFYLLVHFFIDFTSKKQKLHPSQFLNDQKIFIGVWGSLI